MRSAFASNIKTTAGLAGLAGLSGLPSYYPQVPPAWSKLSEAEKKKHNNIFSNSPAWSVYEGKRQKKQRLLSFIKQLGRKASPKEVQVLSTVFNGNGITVEHNNTITGISKTGTIWDMQANPHYAATLQHKSGEDPNYYVIRDFSTSEIARLRAKTKHWTKSDILKFARINGGINLTYQNSNIGLSENNLAQWLANHPQAITRIVKDSSTRNGLIVKPKPKPKPKQKPKPKKSRPVHETEKKSGSKPVHQTVNGGNTPANEPSTEQEGFHPVAKLKNKKQELTNYVHAEVAAAKANKWLIGGAALAGISGLWWLFSDDET